MASTLSIDDMMSKELDTPGLLSLAAGFTDNTIMPKAAVLNIVTALLNSEKGGEALQYGNPSGRPVLRQLIAEYLLKLDQECGSDAGPLNVKDLIMTNGSQQALYVAMQILAKPGEIILVESPTYFVFLDILSALNIKAIGLPSKDDTLDIAALPAFFAALKKSGEFEKIRGIYLDSYFSNPCATCLSTEQKQGLLNIMRTEKLHVPIVEDVAYRELYFNKPWPAASLLPDESDDIPIILTGTLTKSFATGLKIGYAVIKNQKLRKDFMTQKRNQDFGSVHFSQCILEAAINNGEFEKFLHSMRSRYSEKCKILHEALLAEGLDKLGWTWKQSQGSLYIWLTSPNNVTTTVDSDMYHAAIANGVQYVPGNLCIPNGGENKVRLSFGALSTELLPEAAKRFVKAAQQVN